MYYLLQYTVIAKIKYYFIIVNSNYEAKITSYFIIVYNKSKGNILFYYNTVT